MTITPRTHSTTAKSWHRTRPGYLAVAMAIPLLFFGAGTAPAYGDPHEPAPVPPFEDPINADFSPLPPAMIIEHSPCQGCPLEFIEWIPDIPMQPNIPLPTIPFAPSGH